MSVQGFTHKWNRLNHDMSGGADEEGYATCRNCKCAENTTQAADVCWKGPVLQSLRRNLKLELEDMSAAIPGWMRDAMKDKKE